jgi:hydroxyacylglutathione hydrolase
MTVAPTDLGQGVWQFQAPLWQTNSVLAVADSEGLLCDPALMPAEIEAIRAATDERAGGADYLLITHSDFDHTCGIPFFPDATVVAGAATAEAVASGKAAEQLESSGPEWGVTWPTELRVDRVVSPEDEFSLGRFRVSCLDARGHIADGLAFVLLDQGVLLSGDYLSPMTYPFVIASLAEARRTSERLLEALARNDLRWVVPGHGRAISPAEAREIGEADLAYLERLEEAAREAVANGASPGYALLHVFAVEPPRETTDDFEVFGIHASNARRALEEAPT